MAVNDEDETNVLTARFVPFHCTVDDAVKFEPVIVIMVAELLTIAEFGEIKAMLGPLTRTVAGAIAPDKVIPIPETKDGWAVSKNPIVVDVETVPEIWENRTSTDPPIEIVDGTYATSDGNL
jgi:hypothetical protein